MSSCSWEWNHSYEGTVDRMCLKFWTVADCITWIKKSLPALAEVQDILHQLRRGLAVWRGQQPIKKVSTHFIINALQELLDMSSHTLWSSITFHKIMSCLLRTSAVSQMYGCWMGLPFTLLPNLRPNKNFLLTYNCPLYDTKLINPYVNPYMCSNIGQIVQVSTWHPSDTPLQTLSHLFI
jgi:hypothetical protein